MDYFSFLTSWKTVDEIILTVSATFSLYAFTMCYDTIKNVRKIRNFKKDEELKDEDREEE
jgi:hypothetical protein